MNTRTAPSVPPFPAKVGGSDDDDDDDDDGGADDAEMFRMDAKMAAYLRGMVDARKGAKERKAALANLRLRALALIETFAKKVGGGGWQQYGDTHTHPG